eukprot:986884_1
MTKSAFNQITCNFLFNGMLSQIRIVLIDSLSISMLILMDFFTPISYGVSSFISTSSSSLSFSFIGWAKRHFFLLHFKPKWHCSFEEFISLNFLFLDVTFFLPANNIARVIRAGFTSE